MPSRVSRKAGEAFNASMSMWNTFGGEKLPTLSQISFYFLLQLEQGYTVTMILQAPISSAYRKTEIFTLNSAVEKD